MSGHVNTCSHNCFGRKDYDGSCCHLENRDWVIGPHHDTDDFINRLSVHFGRKVNFEEVFYTYEEGSKLFPNKSLWQDERSYPALKVDLQKERKPCIFYNSTIRSCSIYEIRPQTCRKYHCEFLLSQLQSTENK